MPNRILKESICTSDTLDSLSWFEEVLFYRLVVNCDDYGRFDGRTSVIKNRLFPLKDNITNQCIEAAIRKLASVELVTLYVFEGKPYLHLPSWGKHQSVRAKKSKYPAPSEKYLQANDFKCFQGNANVPVIQSNTLYDNKESESIYDTTTNSSLSGAGAREDSPSDFEIMEYFSSRLPEEEAGVEAFRFKKYNAERNWDCLPHWENAADRWIENIQR